MFGAVGGSSKRWFVGSSFHVGAICWRHRNSGAIVGAFEAKGRQKPEWLVGARQENARSAPAATSYAPLLRIMYIMLLARGAGGAGLAGCSSCFNALSNSPGLASGFMRLRTRLVRVDAGTAAFQAVRGLVLAWPAIAAGHFASRLDAILLDAFTPFRPDRRCALLAAARPASVAGRLTVADTLCSFQRRPPSTRTAMKVRSMHSWSPAAGHV